MKFKKRDLIMIIGSVIAVLSIFGATYMDNFMSLFFPKEEPQVMSTRSTDLSETQVANKTLNDSLNARQITRVGRGLTFSEGTTVYSPTQVANKTLDPAENAVQVVTDDSFNDMAFVNITGISPYLRFANTVASDADSQRESIIYWDGKQSGGEVTRLGEISVSHEGAGDDQKGQIEFKPNSGADDNTLTTAFKLDYDTASFQALTDSTTYFQVFDADGGTPILNIDSTNERVGIGIDAPATLLDVEGAVTVNSLDNSGDITLTFDKGIRWPANSSLVEGWGLNFNGDATHPVRVGTATSLLVGYNNTGQVDTGAGNLVILNDITQSGLTVYRTSESVEDDASITDLATINAGGFGFVSIGDDQEYAQFRFNAAGTVIIFANSANVDNADTDAKLCIFTSGTSGIVIKNRLGSALTVKAEVSY